MEFLYKLYSNDFFGIGLFIVITILAFSFLIILFFGKKDEKARNEINKINKELDNNEPLEATKLPVEEVSIEKVEEVIPQEEPIVTENFGPVSNENINVDFKNVEQETLFEKDIEESLEVSNDLDLEEEKEAPQNDFVIESFNLENPEIEEPKRETSFIEQTELRNPEPRRVAMPKQFSSVYVSKDEEPVVERTEEKIERVAPIPLKKDIDLPKAFDLPKLNKSTGTTSSSSDNIIKTFNDNEDNLGNLFDNLEDNSYSIRK